MSSSQAAARVYAEAVFAIAVDDGSLDRVGEELEAVQTALADLPPDVRTFFEMPQLPRDEKWEVVRSAFQDKVSRTVLGLLHVLVDRRREALLGLIVEEFAELADDRAGRIKAVVLTARPLEQQLADALRDALERRTNQKVVLRQRVDPNMIGGIRVSLGDRVVDGTVRGALSDLRRSLASTLN